MENSTAAHFLEKGYKIFALEGPNALKVEVLARAVNKNKSSFYHFFVDLEIFTEQLLQHHLRQAKLLAEKEAKSQNEADLINALLEHKTDLLFNRQLRVHREVEAFEKCFQKTNEWALPAILPVWRKIIQLESNSYLAELVFTLSLENFFLQITNDTLTKTWLESYFLSLRTLVKHVKLAGESTKR